MKLLTRKRLGEMLGVTPQQIAIYDKRGIISPSGRVGRVLIYNDEAVRRVRLYRRMLQEGVRIYNEGILLSGAALARYFGCSRQLIHYLTKRGKIEAFRVGRMRWYDLSDVAQYSQFSTPMGKINGDIELQLFVESLLSKINDWQNVRWS